MSVRVLVTCPPMLGQIDAFQERFEELGWQVTAAKVTQALSVEELIEVVPDHDGWIIGDDPAEESVVAAGVEGRFRAAVKWGVGTDNVDFDGFARHSVPVTNTPAMFGTEVADVALGYVIGLARHTFEIHAGVVRGDWPKPAGISLAGKKSAVVGYGDIGKQLVRRLQACGVSAVVYDPFYEPDPSLSDEVEVAEWPEQLSGCDFICFTCALTDSNRGMFNNSTLPHLKQGCYVVNVARGPLIQEAAVIDGLRKGIISAVAMDVFEEEPLGMDNGLRDFTQNVFGSHNASNTLDAVMRTSQVAIERLRDMLE